MEKSVLVREAMPALPPAPAAAGFASPPAATVSALAITIFWAGQITNHTLAHIKVPIRPPVRMRVM